VATELPNHITHADTRQGVQQLYDKAEDIAEIIAFILNRPRHLANQSTSDSLRPGSRRGTPSSAGG